MSWTAGTKTAARRKTLERWRRDIRRDLERQVDVALVEAHEILAHEGLIVGEAA